MVICCVPLCRSRSDRGCNLSEDGKKITFHQFPCDEIRKTAWTQAISRQGINSNSLWKPKRTSTVCSRHFTEDCFKQGPKIRVLLPTSVPTIFSDFPTHKQKTYHKRREINRQNVPIKHKSSISSEMENLQMLSSICNEQEYLSIKTDIGINTNLSANKLEAQKQRYRNLLQRFRRLQKAVQKKNTVIKGIKDENKELKKKLVKLSVQKLESCSNEKGKLLIEQLKYFGKKKPRWDERTIRYSILLQSRSQSAYSFLRRKNLFSLPSRSTLRRYIGPTTGDTVSSLIKQRLCQEAKKLINDREFFGSLIIDEMNIKPSVHYNTQSDEIVGLITTKTEISELGIEQKVADRFLCFIFTGLSTNFRLPVAYYFSKGMTGEDLASLTKDVIKGIEDTGFRVVRIVTDNHITNVKMFGILSGDNSPKPVIPHPFDPSRKIFLSYDPCHIVKNLRNLLFSRHMINQEQPISANFIKTLYNLQNENIIRPVRNLTYKHVYPSNFQKMNVSRALKIFSTELISALKFLQQNAQRLGQLDFLNASATIQFLEMVQKWFNIHNISNRYQHITSRNPDVMHFASINDDRLYWLENVFLNYLEEWQSSCTDPFHFLSKETYFAIKLTTESTVKCVKFLLESGFHYVLTRKLTSDEIESFFSAIRQMSGSNDMTNATNCIQNLHKVLVTGIAASSSNANVKTSSGDEWLTDMKQIKNSKVDAVLPPGNFMSNLKELEVYPAGLPIVSVEAASMAYVAGYLVHAVEKEIECFSCLELISTQKCPSPLMGLIYNGDRGGRKYPKPSFVMLLLKIEKVLKLALLEWENIPNISAQLRKTILPHLSLNPLLICTEPNHSSSSHSLKLCDEILKKFLNPYLTNYANNESEIYLKKRRLKFNKKPISRKALKVAIT